MSATTFKLEATKFHLDEIIKLKKQFKTIVHSEARFKADVAVDGFLCEIMSAIGSLLHDVNDGLKLGIAAEDVNLKKVKQKMKHQAGFNATDLGDLNNLYSEGHWLCDLRKLRNYSVHQRLLGMHITLELPAGSTRVYLTKPWIPHSRTEKEVIPYFKDQLKNVRKLVNDVKTRLNLP